MDSDGYISLTDFGISRYSLDQTKEVVGTVGYLSPETWKNKEYNENTDWWGFGVLL